MVKKIDLMYSSLQLNNFKQDLVDSFSKIIDSGQFIMGSEVSNFENSISDFTGVKHSIGCANGTDALTIALVALGLKPNDVVFVPSFTFTATAETIAILGGIPFFVDVNSEDFNISPESLELAIDEARSQGLNIRGVITVDLFGNPCEYDEVSSICKEHNLFHISDIAQALGAKYKGKSVAQMGDIAATSFFPTKPLGCFGDGGMLFTQNDDLAKIIRSLCVHGKGDHKYDNVRVGFNSRLDTLQACALNHKLPFFQKELNARNDLGNFYNLKLGNKIRTPKILNENFSAWAVYTLLHPKRDEIIHKLSKYSIPSNIYYQTTLHNQPAYNHFPKAKNMYNSEYYAREVFCLPMHAYITEEQRQFIADKLLEILEEIDGNNYK